MGTMDPVNARGEEALDTVDDEQAPRTGGLPADVTNDNVKPENPSPEDVLEEATATIDPDPDAEFAGVPLTDAEVDALEIEE